MLASQAQALLGQSRNPFPGYTGLGRATLPTRPRKALQRAVSGRCPARRSLVCRALEGQISSPKGSLFGAERELSGAEKVLEGLPAPARYASSVVVVAGALAAGYLLGSRYKSTQVAAVGGAVALGAVGGAAVVAFNAAAPKVAAAQLRNSLVHHPDPTTVTPADIDGIARKYITHPPNFLYLVILVLVQLLNPRSSSFCVFFRFWGRLVPNCLFSILPLPLNFNS